jgi:hypothetical protein
MSDSESGWERVDEVARARAEDPGFAEVLARKRAMARNETYTPERHGPFVRTAVPRAERVPETRVNIDVAAVLARFTEKGRPVKDFKQAAANDQ